MIVAEGGEGSASPSGLLRAVLEQEGVEIAGEVLSLSELIQLAADEQPDAVVFATRAPQEELDRLRSVAPSSKIVFVSPILIAAEAEMAEAVVERADVLASLGPVLVHLCAPGRLNARRAMTEGFDRPDWIDRVRKDPVTLREILTDGMPEESGDRPSVTSLQGEARAASLADDQVVRLPDLEAEPVRPPQRRRDDVPVRARPEGVRRRRWFGFWAVALSALTFVCLWILPATIPAALVHSADPPVVPLPFGGDDAAEPGDEPRPPDRDRVPRDPDAEALEPGGGTGATAESGTGSGTGEGPGEPPGGGGDHDGVDGGVDDPGAGLDDMPGSSAEHNPHGAPPGQSGEHPEPKEPQLPQ